MIIEIGKLSPDGSTFEGEELKAILELDSAQNAQVLSDIRYRIFAQRIAQELVVQGQVEADFSLECGRCLEFFSTTVQDSSFLRAYEISDNVESVDLTQDIREAILLNLPAYPLCSVDCLGLCPQCGKNLNEGACTCKPSSGDDRWGSLDGIKLS